MKLEIKYLESYSSQNIPPLVHNHVDAGIDLRSTIAFTLKPNESIIVPTGVCIKMDTNSLPEHISAYANVVPRSGYGFKFLRIANTVGVIDPSYQEEIKIKLRNESVDRTFDFEVGDRFCQMIVTPFIKCEVEATGFDSGNRGGFGASGVK